MSLCPFHRDKHPSLKLNDRYFYCFGCHATGDVIRFTAMLFALTDGQAAQKLMSDFRLTNHTTTPAVIDAYAAQAARQAEQTDIRRVLHTLRASLELLETQKALYAPKQPESPTDERFVETCRMIDLIQFLIERLTLGSMEERSMALKMLRREKALDGLLRLMTLQKMEGRAKSECGSSRE